MKRSMALSAATLCLALYLRVSRGTAHCGRSLSRSRERSEILQGLTR